MRPLVQREREEMCNRLLLLLNSEQVRMLIGPVVSDHTCLAQAYDSQVYDEMYVYL